MLSSPIAALSWAPNLHIHLRMDLKEPAVNHCFHIYSRCIDADWFHLSLDTVWKIMEDHLFFLHYGFGFRLHAFVLLPGYFQMIVTTDTKNLSLGMCYFMRETSRQIAHKTNRINQIYKSTYHKSIISCPLYYLHTYKYLYRLPVEMSLAESSDRYPYSTLQTLLGVSNATILVYDDILLSKDSRVLNWLNTSPKPEHTKEIQRALKKKVFRLAKNRNTKKTSDLESVIY